MNGKDLIEKLQLQVHPEGGYYKQTYRSAQFIQTPQNQTRSVSTTIYFLLNQDDKSLFHRIQSDEHWFFHQGESLEIVFIENGNLRSIDLGNKIEEGERPQTMIPANTWFGARLKNSTGFALVSCTVAPGFDFLDFELANRESLCIEFPHLKDIIQVFTPEN